MVKRGLITDALSVLAIQSYALWQHSGEDLPPLVEI